MRITLAVVAYATLAVASGFGGDAAIIIKQHAREISDQNNVRQGVAPPTQPSRPTQPTTTSPTTASVTPVQQALAKVRADLTALKAGSPVTAAQKQQLAKDLLAAAQGANKPSLATVTTLAEDLSAAYSQKPLSEDNLKRLLTDLAAAFNPANIQPTQMQAVVADVQAIFQVNGLARKDAMKIADDLKAIAAEARR